jgi:hypothetical protein
VKKISGYYRIVKNDTNTAIVIYNSPGFYSIIEKLKKIFDFGDGSNQGGPPPPPPPTPEYPTTGNHALVGELIQTIANKTGLPPEEVKKIKTDFSFTSKGFVKIQAIKALRNFYNQQGMITSLHFSKLVSEHWQDFLAYVLDNGLPEQKEFESKILNYRTKKNSTKTLTNEAVANQLIQIISQITEFPIEDIADGKFPPSQKIPIIKAIRTYYSNLGKTHTLLGAKLAIQHWVDFIAYVRDNGLPDMGVAKYNKDDDSNDSVKPDISYIGYSSKKKQASSGNSPALLTDDEKEWFTTFFSPNYPHLEVDLAPDGMVYINQPDPNVINEITKGYKPLFIIYKSSPTTYVFKKASGGENVFSSFSELAIFVSSAATALIPAAPKTKTPQQIGLENALKYNYSGANLEGVSFDKKLAHNGFVWNNNNGAYFNKNLYQFVVIKPEFGIIQYNVYWVAESGEIQAFKTIDLSELYSSIGPRGSIAKGKKSAATDKKENNPYSPSPVHEELLKKLGFVKDTNQNSPVDTISYTKQSDDSGNAYFRIDIYPYTGNVEYSEVDEEGTSEGYSYPTLGHALSFLKNKFAEELVDNDDDDDDDENSMNSLESEIQNIAEELSKIGFIYKETDGQIYEYVTSDGKHYAAFNADTGKLTYGIQIPSEPGVYDIVKSFYEIDQFVDYYIGNKKDNDNSNTSYFYMNFFQLKTTKQNENYDIFNTESKIKINAYINGIFGLIIIYFYPNDYDISKKNFNINKCSWLINYWTNNFGYKVC